MGVHLLLPGHEAEIGVLGFLGADILAKSDEVGDDAGKEHLAGVVGPNVLAPEYPPHRGVRLFQKIQLEVSPLLFCIRMLFEMCQKFDADRLFVLRLRRFGRPRK